MKRTVRTTAPTVGALIAAPGLPAGAAHADPAPRTDLKVLLVGDGGPATDAVAAERWPASDNSRDPEQRVIGPATVARHPVNVSPAPRTRIPEAVREPRSTAALG
ncbi:hypothetical protein [Streptomyces sp. NRRL S-87]|uniref:hypothetical protein n=1 Tax=Streptomyces sp. NRRL S-87 TaxID=1463920 RepID=UPI0004BE7693|nr:hypothetical protein [Streptomyces sp. NRRL S-87]